MRHARRAEDAIRLPGRIWPRSSYVWLLAAIGVALAAAGPAGAMPGPSHDLAFPPLPLPPEVGPPTGAEREDEPVAYPRGRANYVARVRAEAERQGLPPQVADAVAQIESSYDPNAVGGVGEIGLMQIRPATAAMLGFRGRGPDLHDPDLNIRYAVAYLAQAWRLADGELCRALMKYRAGHGESRMTQRSVTYCARVRAHIAAVGSVGDEDEGAEMTTAAIPLPPARPTLLLAALARKEEEDSAREVEARIRAAVPPPAPVRLAALIEPAKARVEPAVVPVPPVGAAGASAPAPVIMAAAGMPSAEGFVAAFVGATSLVAAPDAAGRLTAAPAPAPAPAPPITVAPAPKPPAPDRAERWAEHDRRMKAIQAKLSTRSLSIMR